MSQPDYSVVVEVLQNYKGLGESEAKLFVKLMERPRFTIDDVKTILKDIGEKKANSRAYQLLDSLKKNDLIDEIKKSNPKTYRPVHPRVVLEDIKKRHTGFEDSFGVIEQAYETFTDIDGTESCVEIFSSETMMLSKIQDLIRRGYKIKKMVSNNGNITKLLSRVSKEDYSKQEETGDTDYIIFENKNEKLVFAVFNKSSVSGKNRKEAVCITDTAFATNLQKR